MQPAREETVELVVIGLLLIQMLVARYWLGKRRVSWKRPVFVAGIAFVAIIWAVTIAAICLSWTGTIYTQSTLPPAIPISVVAIGYFWILISSAALAVVLAVHVFLSRRRLPGEYSAQTEYSSQTLARRRFLRAAGLAALGVPAATAAVAFVKRDDYRIREIELPVAGLHPDFDGYRIAQVSDLHVSPFLSPAAAGRAIDMANELRPDLALFTGDLISEIGDPLDAAIRELIRLRGPDGVLGCMGNHEGYVGCRKYLANHAGRAGVNFLRNSAIILRRGKGTLNIAGVDYQKKSVGPYLPDAEKLVVSGMPNILLSHNPDVFPVAVSKGFPVTLSGHTHGGQINVEILEQNVNPARFRTPFTSGLYLRGEASCFVTNGVGTIGIPVRVGAPAEIALLTLRRA